MPEREGGPAPVGRRGGAASLRRVALALLVAACSLGGVPDPQSYDGVKASRMFTVGYQDISEIYIEEVGIPALARAGLAGLANLDPDMRVSEADGELVVAYRGLTLASYPAPPAADAKGWGELTAEVIHLGRKHSRPLAEAEPEAIYQAVFDGIVTALDRFSRYAGRDAARENRASRDGFGGIGVRIRVVDEGVKILSVMEDTPAAEAGLEVEDVIVSIDGLSAVGLSQREVVRRLRGPIRTKVRLLVDRESEAALLPVSITRALVVPQTVEAHLDGAIDYIRVSNFNQGTARSLRQKIRAAERELGEALVGFIVDLRGNPGGLLDQGVEVADLFVPEGRIVSTRGRHPDSHQYFDADSDDVAEGRPVVVLLDGSSASAAEIVAAALQDSGRAVLVGTNTFGKGTVQTVLRLPNEGELTLTWATFHAPSGYGLQEQGVLPQICTSGGVEGSADALDRLRQGEFPLRRRALITAATGEDRKAQIAALRNRCPQRDGEPEIDLEVARALLLDPNLYGRALGLTPPDSAAVQQEALLGAAAGCPESPSLPATQPASC